MLEFSTIVRCWPSFPHSRTVKTRPRLDFIRIGESGAEPKPDLSRIGQSRAAPRLISSDSGNQGDQLLGMIQAMQNAAGLHLACIWLASGLHLSRETEVTTISSRWGPELAFLGGS